MSAESLIHRTERELTLLKAVASVTTRADRILIDMDCSKDARAIPETYWWHSVIANIREEFHRLRKKKGKPS